MNTSRAIVTTYIERVWSQGDLAALDELTTPGFTYRLGEQPPRDRGAFRELLTSFRAAFPDWRVEIEEIVAEAGMVVVRWLGRATHRGVFHGLAPTGRAVTVSGINLYHLDADRIASEWEHMDTLGLLRQLGALP